MNSTSLGVSVGKTVKAITGSLASSANTADQVIATYTVPKDKTFFLQQATVDARLTTYATTATLYGTVSLELPSGTKVITADVFNAGQNRPVDLVRVAEPIPIAGGTVVRIVCTPSASTAFSWSGWLLGYLA